MRHRWRGLHQRIGYTGLKYVGHALGAGTSCAKTVGERSPVGRAISRTHTEIPSHMLRAANSSCW